MQQLDPGDRVAVRVVGVRGDRAAGVGQVHGLRLDSYIEEVAVVGGSHVMRTTVATVSTAPDSTGTSRTSRMPVRINARERSGSRSTVGVQFLPLDFGRAPIEICGEPRRAVALAAIVEEIGPARRVRRAATTSRSATRGRRE